MAGNSPERAWKADKAIDSMRRMERRLRNAIVYGVIVSWTAFPIVGALIATVVSAICGCTGERSRAHTLCCFRRRYRKGALHSGRNGMAWRRNLAHGRRRLRSLHDFCRGAAADLTAEETIVRKEAPPARRIRAEVNHALTNLPRR